MTHSVTVPQDAPQDMPQTRGQLPRQQLRLHLALFTLSRKRAAQGLPRLACTERLHMHREGGSTRAGPQRSHQAQ